MEKEIFTVIIVLVFGGIDSVVTFATQEEANRRIIEWSNENNPDGISFETAFEALEWFRINDELVDNTIQLYTSTINHKTSGINSIRIRNTKIS